jgi:proteic killer suppression protein
MIVSFLDRGTEDIFDGTEFRKARQTCPRELWQKAQDRMTVMNAVTELESLKLPPGNRLEALKGDRAGQHSIRINSQYRICFRWTDSGPADVEIVDYH